MIKASMTQNKVDLLKGQKPRETSPSEKELLSSMRPDQYPTEKPRLKLQKVTQQLFTAQESIKAVTAKLSELRAQYPWLQSQVPDTPPPSVEADQDFAARLQQEQAQLQAELSKVDAGQRGEVETGQQEEVVKVESFDEAVQQVKDHFKAELEKRFGTEGVEALDYHSPEHSRDVAKEAREFLEIIQSIDPDLVADHDLDFVEIEGFAHDAVQEYSLDEAGNRERKRGFDPEYINLDSRPEGFKPGNEQASADELIQELRKYRLLNGEEVFTHFSAEETAMDIGVTYPNVRQEELPKEVCPAHLKGVKCLKIEQPYLTKDSSLRALALATADLRKVYVENLELSIVRRENNAEFREIYQQVNETIEASLKTGDVERVSVEQRVDIGLRMLDWIRLDEGFIRWQQVLFEQSIEENAIINSSEKAEEIKQTLRERYLNFEKAAQKDRQRYEYWQKKFNAQDPETFKELVREMGYKIGDG